MEHEFFSQTCWDPSQQLSVAPPLLPRASVVAESVDIFAPVPRDGKRNKTDTDLAGDFSSSVRISMREPGERFRRTEKQPSVNPLLESDAAVDKMGAE